MHTVAMDGAARRHDTSAAPPVRILEGQAGSNAAALAMRAYLDELLPGVLSGEVEPGLVFDRELPLDEAAEAYRLMDEREALKVLLRP